MTEHEFLHGYLSVYPFGRQRIMIFNIAVADGVESSTVTVMTLDRAEECTLRDGRFSRLTGEVYGHRYGLDIRHSYGVSIGSRRDEEREKLMGAAVDWIANETTGRWTLTYAQKDFQCGPHYGWIRWPYPVFMFELAEDAVKFALIHG